MACAPIAMAIVFLDQFYFEGLLKDIMDIGSGHVVDLMAILTFPHIFASLISFADREYYTYYRTPLIKGIAISLGLAVISKFIIGGHAILVTVAFYSIYHNIMQQFGISAMMLRQKPTKTYTAMKWLMVIPTWLAYAVVTFPIFPGMVDYQDEYIFVVGLCIAAATVLAVRYYLQIRHNEGIPAIGTQYFVSNVVWMIISYIMVVMGYALLALLVSRIIHDITAYWIYMVHDQNRNNKSTPNPVYILPKKLGIKPIYILLPLSTAVALALLAFENHGDVMAVIIGAFNMMHYYIEGHTWKRGTPHRQHVPFV